MKKLISFFLVIVFFLTGKITVSQVNNYSFSQGNGTYSQISGGLIVASATGTSGPASLDDVIYPLQTLPFTFTFNNISYNSYSVSSNGFITFGNTLPGNSNWAPISSTEPFDGTVSGIGRDIQGVIGITATKTIGSNVLSNVSSFQGVEIGKVITGTGIPTGTTVVSLNPSLQQISISNPAILSSTGTAASVASGEIRTTTTGVIGDRIHTIQWKNFRKFGAVGDYFNFQIKLYESANQIRIVYGTFVSGSVTGQSQVGLRGNINSDFKNRKTIPVNPNWLQTLPGTNNYDTCRLSSGSIPGLGLTFIYDLPFHIDMYFSQNNFNYNGWISNNSDWGTITVTQSQFTGIKYLNLAINSPGVPIQWQIQNAMLQGNVSPGNIQTDNISFNIAPMGMDISNILYGVSITDHPVFTPPLINSSAPVSDFQINMSGGDDDRFSFIDFTQEPAVPFVVAVNEENFDTAKHIDFPNQECPEEMYCSPTGVSNSLIFLNKKHNLGMDTNKIKIYPVAGGLGTDENGTPLDWLPNKKKYMEDNKLPITSRELGESEIKNILKEIKNGQDVELRLFKVTASGDTISHCAAMTGIVDTKDGKYQVSTNDDKDQGTAGGLRTNEKSVYDTTSKQFTDGIFKGWKIRSFVVECPNKLETTPQSPPNNANGVAPDVPLEWSVTPGARSYWLEVAADPNFINKIVDERNIIPNSFILPSLDIFWDLYWRVRVNDSVGPGAPSVVFHFTLANSGSGYTSKFYQNDYNLGNSFLYNSDWGTLEITMPHFTGLKYLNLTTNTPGTTTQWQIKNGIIQNQTAPGGTQTHTFTFDIGTRGVDVSNINYAIEITSMPLLSNTPVNSTASVYPRMVGPRNGNSISVPIPEPPLAKPFECPVDPDLLDSAAHEDFPNQECPLPKYCTPTAISNSLIFLNKKHNLGMDTNKIKIDSIAKGLGTDTTNGSPENWPTKKKKYMEDNKLPITTRELPAGDVKNIKKEIFNGQDVEIDIDNDTMKHTACVTGIVDLGNGKYEISTSDDTEQGKAGGLSTNAKSIYDTTDKKFTSGELSDFKIVRFIVECPNKLKTDPSSPSNNSFNVSPMTPMMCNPVPGASSYWFEVSSVSNFASKVIDERNVPTNTYTPVLNQLQSFTTYFWRIRVNDSAGPGEPGAVFTFTTKAGMNLNLTAYIQGLYDASSNTMTADTGKVYLRNSSSPYNVIDSAKALLNTNGTGIFTFFNATNGVNYYIDFRHRNTIQTWSSTTQPFTAGVMNYNFTNLITKAYGNNMKQVDTSPVRFASYNGDVNQDEVIDVGDIILIYNDLLNSASGYINTDLNGDGITDVSDLIIAYNNALNNVTVIRP